MPEDKKTLDEILKALKEKDASTEDIASSDDLKDLEKALHERHDQTEKQTDLLKEDADRNKGFNRAQIAMEALKYTTETKENKKWRSKQVEVADIQKKHNRGAKDAREIMLQQNKLILEAVNRLERDLQDVKKGGGGGGSGGAH